MNKWKSIRENAGLTQSNIAKVFGITRQAISQFERESMPKNIQGFYYRLDKDIIKANECENEYKEKLERLRIKHGRNIR